MLANVSMLPLCVVLAGCAAYVVPDAERLARRLPRRPAEVSVIFTARPGFPCPLAGGASFDEIQEALEREISRVARVAHAGGGPLDLVATFIARPLEEDGRGLALLTGFVHMDAIHSIELRLADPGGRVVATERILVSEHMREFVPLPVSGLYYVIAGLRALGRDDEALTACARACALLLARALDRTGRFR